MLETLKVCFCRLLAHHHAELSTPEFIFTYGPLGKPLSLLLRSKHQLVPPQTGFRRGILHPGPPKPNEIVKLPPSPTVIQVRSTSLLWTKRSSPLGRRSKCVSCSPSVPHIQADNYFSHQSKAFKKIKIAKEEPKEIEFPPEWKRAETVTVDLTSDDE